MRYKTKTLHIPVRWMKLLVLRPAGAVPSGPRIAVPWLHGGGYITGMPEMVHSKDVNNGETAPCHA